MKIVAASDCSLLVVVGDSLQAETSARVLRLFAALRTQLDSRIKNLHPGYTTLLVDFDPLETTHGEVATMVERAAEGTLEGAVLAARLVEIPVCYGGEFGPDLADVAAHAGLADEEVIWRHSAAAYSVAFLGFTVGFAYLVGMPEELSMPRVATPRRAVAAGSVGIAGGQTGIYPTVTPGGWRLIGRTPLRMCDPRQSPPTRLEPGDHVRFRAVDRREFERLTQAEA